MSLDFSLSFVFRSIYDGNSWLKVNKIHTQYLLFIDDMVDGKSRERERENKYDEDDGVYVCYFISPGYFHLGLVFHNGLLWLL